ncbi:MAG: hypothetical protein DI562_02165 [Stenotrophomonas acidaminiphila]|nr:MAG: hypothetical protein DI562_02165 [Stenotrophomonas acidaminiphila]
MTALALVACERDAASRQQQEQALLQAPAVGDHYAAELTYFSDADFEQVGRAFGLVKVITVDGDDVTLVTENGGSTDERAALEALAEGGGKAGFDDNERIILRKGDLLDAYEAGKILGVRR